MGYIQPDRVFNVPIQNGELHISPAYDVIHHFPPLRAYIFKYWNQETGRMVDLHMHEASAGFLVAQCGIQMLDRTFITEFEHERHLDWRSEELTDDML